MTNNYNAIAGFYDALSKLVFQKSIINAQVFLLHQVVAGSNVLIVGGGTGWVLEKLAKIHQENINITYVEKSAKMIALSKKRDYKSNKVEFFHQPVEDFITNKRFDVVFTAFLFDNFLPEKIDVIFSKLDDALKPGGLWLYADFKNDNDGKLWQRLLLKTMYLFFKVTCNIETQCFISTNKYFAKNYIQINEAFFYSNFIQSKVFQKTKQ